MFVKCLIVCVLATLAQAGPPLVGVRYAAAPTYGYAHPAPVYAQPLAPAYAHPAPVYAHPAPVYAQPTYAVPQVGIKYAAPVLQAAPAAPVLAAAPVPVATAVKVATPVVQHAPQPYDFGYNLQTDDGGSSFRSETGDELNNKKGSFGYTSPDGIYRQVDYIADAAGFRATIRTNEQGTANQNPASVAVLAEESPIKVVKTVPVVKAAVATPVYASAPVVKAVAQPVYAAPTYAAPAVVRTPVYASAAAPALVRAPAPVYAAHPTVYGRHVAAVAPYARAYY